MSSSFPPAPGRAPAALAAAAGLAACVLLSVWTPARSQPASAGPGAASANPGGAAKEPKPATPGPDDPGPDAEVVGAALCDSPACHGTLMRELEKTPHSRYTQDVKLGDRAGCEVCHGPAGNHVGDPDKRRTPRFTVESRATSRQIDRACLQCHQKSLSPGHFEGTAHARAGQSCASCHEVHYDLGTPYMLRLPGAGGPAGAPVRERRKTAESSPPPSPEPAAPSMPEAEPPPHEPRFAAVTKRRVPIPGWRSSFTREPGAVTEQQAVNELCGSCHRKEIAEARLLAHHPVLEGRVKCTDCHSPHRSQQGRQLTRRNVAETCLECHEQYRGPFRFEHEPVRVGGLGDACLECHRPHGSPNRGMLSMAGKGICVQCHSDIQRDPPHRSRPGDCWRAGCHTAIHGSDHSRLLLRE